MSPRSGPVRPRISVRLDPPQLERLDAVQAAYWDAMIAGDVAAATIVLKVIAERIRVLGLDREGKAGRSTRTIYDMPSGG